MPLHMTPPPPTETVVRRLHAAYCKHTGFRLEFNTTHFWPWEQFALRFNEQDLEIAIKANKFKGKWGRSLLFRNFIAGPSSLEFLAEDIAEAKCRMRKNPPPPKGRIAGPSGVLPPLPDRVQTTKQVLEGPALDEFLTKLKKDAGLI